MNAIQKEKYDELMHYGVKGMKWGVRRTDAQLGRHTLAKGTVMFRTTAHKNESTSGAKYVTYLEPDRRHYSGVWARTIAENQSGDSSAKVYEKTFELTEDVVVPSRDEVKEVLTGILKEETAREESFSEYSKMLIKNVGSVTVSEAQAIDMVYEKHNGDWAKCTYDEVYDILKEASIKDGEVMAKGLMDRYGEMPTNELFKYGALSLGSAETVKNKLISELSNRGYSAMVDEASVGGKVTGSSREGLEPLIIFDGDKHLTTKDTSEISKRREQKDSQEYMKWLNKANAKGNW